MLAIASGDRSRVVSAKTAARLVSKLCTLIHGRLRKCLLGGNLLGDFPQFGEAGRWSSQSAIHVSLTPFPRASLSHLPTHHRVILVGVLTTPVYVESTTAHSGYTTGMPPSLLAWAIINGNFNDHIWYFSSVRCDFFTCRRLPAACFRPSCLPVPVLSTRSIYNAGVSHGVIVSAFVTAYSFTIEKFTMVFTALCKVT